MKVCRFLLSLSLVAGACNRSDSPEPKPVAKFEAPTTAETGTTLSLRNTSIDATSYVWTWGDGTTSTDQNPAHIFSLTGNYRVLLRASSTGGSDTLSRVVAIKSGAPTAAVLASVTGKYRGVLYSRVVVSGSYPPAYRSLHRDTTLLVTALDPKTLQCLGASIWYQPGTVAQPSSPWFGHAPQRSNHLFNTSFAPPSNAVVLQFEQLGDSCFFNKRVGSMFASDKYTFYAINSPNTHSQTSHLAIAGLGSVLTTTRGCLQLRAYFEG